MPLLYVVTEQMDSPHGTQMFAALIIDEVVRRGWRVKLFTAHYNPKCSAWREFLAERHVPVVRACFWFLTRYHLPHHYVSMRLWRLVRRERPNLIWSPDNEPMTCRALESMPPKSQPYFVHDPSAASEECPHYPALWFDVCGRVTGLTVHGKRQAESASRYYKLDRPIQAVWPASFPPGRTVTAPRSTGPVRFGQFGRLHFIKGSHFTVGAFARVIELGHAAELHFYGDGPFASETKDLVSSLGLKKYVYFHGSYRLEELDDLIEGIDVGVMPSMFEGFGLVMLEMMSRGRPVISSAVGSSREVLEGMGCGWVVRRADTEDLAQAMIRCCADPVSITAMGKKARTVWHAHFTPARMFDRFLAFWKVCGADVPAPVGEAEENLAR